MGNCLCSNANQSGETNAVTILSENKEDESKSLKKEPADHLIALLNAGLGKDSPIKMWVDSDCTSFDNVNTKDRNHPHARSFVDVDDGWALCCLINSPRIDLVGISSSFGNDYEYWTYKSLEQLLSFANKTKEIPLYHGAKNKLRSLSSGGYQPYKDPSKLETKTNDAVEGLANTLRSLNDGEKLYIYADGPCTNIAILLILYPQLRSKIGFICVFMGRQTVIKPKFQFGSKQVKDDTFFTDFNFNLDPFACQLLLTQANIPVILVGCQLAKNSLIMYNSDIKYLHHNTPSGSLINELTATNNSDYPLPSWLKMWKGFGNYLPPWPKDEAWDGFVPFGVMSASLFFYSELLNVKKVTPSIPLVKVKSLGTIEPNFSEQTTGANINTNTNKMVQIDSADEQKTQAPDLGFHGVKTVNYFAGFKPYSNEEIIDEIVLTTKPSYFEYFLCTSPNSSAGMNAVVIDQTLPTLENVYYVPSIKNESYPWSKYKQKIIDLLKS